MTPKQPSLEEAAQPKLADLAQRVANLDRAMDLVPSVSCGAALEQAKADLRVALASPQPPEPLDDICKECGDGLVRVHIYTGTNEHRPAPSEPQATPPPVCDEFCVARKSCSETKPQAEAVEREAAASPSVPTPVCESCGGKITNGGFIHHHTKDCPVLNCNCFPKVNCPVHRFNCSPTYPAAASPSVPPPKGCPVCHSIYECQHSHPVGLAQPAPDYKKVAEEIVDDVIRWNERDGNVGSLRLDVLATLQRNGAAK